MSDEREEEKMPRRRTSSEVKAATKHSWWPGWIWAVPLAAFGIGVWLLVRFLTQGGTDITITFEDAYGISAGDTVIKYRGTKVGSIESVDLSQDGKGVKVEATIKDSAKQFLTTGTLFYLRGAQPSLSNLSSLGSVLSGPTVVMEPGPGKKTKHFQGLEKKPEIPRQHGPPVLFRVHFDGAVGDLKEGDAVKLRGFAVGEVKETGFHYDAETGKIRTPVTVALYPTLFQIEHAAAKDPAAALQAALKHLVEEGLRASLDREPPLIGSYRVSFEMVPGAPQAELKIADNLPEIPTAPGGGLQSLVSSVNKIPLDQISQNVLDLTKHLDQLASSPKLKESFAELDASLQEIHRTVETIGPKVDQLVRTLRNTAHQLDQASAATAKTIGGPASQNGLNDTMREVKDAARSIRSLADYLERHPESLISGKHGE
ncbi:MAG TPA: MlaD family protein [Chthoniobacterales bacterium]